MEMRYGYFTVLTLDFKTIYTILITVIELPQNVSCQNTVNIILITFVTYYILVSFKCWSRVLFRMM